MRLVDLEKFPQRLVHSKHCSQAQVHCLPLDSMHIFFMWNPLKVRKQTLCFQQRKCIANIPTPSERNYRRANVKSCHFILDL